MTIIPDRDVQSALNDALYDAFPNTPVAWENTKYTPTVGTTYFQVWLMPVEPDVLTIGPSPWQIRRGIFQVSVFSPISVGFGASKAVAAQIIAAFKPNTSFVYNGLTVIVDKSWVSMGRVDEADGGWYHTPVSVRYRCYYAD
jgi:hypothetical protein